jgi:molybdenum cofactor sulfurtransferase
MITNLFGNPHSTSDPSQLSGHMVDSIREKTLAFFNADPEHFDIVFTANATAAIKLVGECFRDLASASPTSSTFWYGYHKDAHTSVVGIREMTNGNHHCFTSDDEVEKWLNNFQTHSGTPRNSTIPGLFCYPGQSNMTGRRLPLSWTRRLRQSNVSSHQNTYSLLDAAALATTTQLDFSDPEAAPDFTAVSFYKIFGFPDLGALIVRKDSGHIPGWRKYFGGGTVNMVTVFHEPSVQRKEKTLHDALEDGTLPFHNIIALGCAIDVHMKLYGSMKLISQHTSFLSRRLYLGMINLRHFNGIPLCVVYNDVPARSEYGDPVTQGSTVAFNLMKADGNYMGHSLVEKIANEKGIFLRSGGLCNSGGISDYLHVEPWQFKRAWSAGHRCGEEGIDLVSGKPTGVVRASLGAMSTISEVETFLDFLTDVFVEQPRVLEQRMVVEPTQEEYLELARCERPVVIEEPREQYTDIARYEKINLAPLSFEKPHPQESGYGSKFVTVTAYTKRPVYEQRPPPISNSTFHHGSTYQGAADSSRTLARMHASTYSTEVDLRGGERPLNYQERPQKTIKDDKRHSLTKFWKRRKSLATINLPF